MSWNEAISAVEAEIIRLTEKWGDPNGSPYEQGAQDHGNRLWKAVKDLQLKEDSVLANQNTNLRNDLVLAGMARDSAERERDEALERAEKAEKALSELSWMMDGLRK